ncbi:unnamed protein product [Camellia sinensis]
MERLREPKMVRAPCCEKMGLKRGPWTPQEDHILINYINLYGHSNWRALPKQAGLLRCGKSCRLRWANYLKPDIKRGNFSEEEEETIIKLHEKLGNRWSAIAARLPGRTDNEIKNVWHTHLKKRLKQKQPTQLELEIKPPHSIKIQKNDQVTEKEPEEATMTYPNAVVRLQSPEHSASDISSITTTSTDNTTTTNTTSMDDDAFDNFPVVDENFWSDVFSVDNSGEMDDFPVAGADPDAQFQLSPRLHAMEHICGGNNSSMHDGMDFWFNLFTKAGGLPELPEF